MTARSVDPSNLNVAAVLVNWNNWRDAVECLDALLGQRHERLHVFVVDNQSSDSSVEHIVRWCRAPHAMAGWRQLPGVCRYTDAKRAEIEEEIAPIGVRLEEASSMPFAGPSPDTRVTVVRSGGNLGFAGGCNVGVAAAGLDPFDYFWFLNTDTVVESQALSALLRRAVDAPAHGLLGSTLRYYDAPDRVQALGGGQLDGRTMVTRHIGEGTRIDELSMSTALVEARLAHICGASMLASRGFIHDIGPMQEDYFLYYEEYDWAMRGRGRYSLGYASDSHVFHKAGASSSKIMPLFSLRLFYRNRVRFAGRFYPEHLGAIKRGLLFEVLRQVLRGRWRVARAVAETLWSAGRLAREVSTNV